MHVFITRVLGRGEYAYEFDLINIATHITADLWVFYLKIAADKGQKARKMIRVAHAPPHSTK